LKVHNIKEDEMRKTIKLFSFLASFVIAGAFSQALAQTAAATPAAPTVVVGGMVDTYFAYDFTHQTAGTTGLGTGYFYNNVDSSYTMGLAEAKVTATQGPASAHLVLAYGQEGALALGAAPGIDVLQAYVSYTSGQWTFNAGKFVTWMGYEVIESSSNWNYSHSLLFGTLPFWHTGMSVNFAPSSSFGITGYVVDGINTNTTPSSVIGKEYGLEFAITPNSMWTITLNGMFGPADQPGTVPLGISNDLAWTGEAIVVYKPDSMWSFALDAEMGSTALPAAFTAPSSLSYWGIALYGRDQIASDFAIALRLEDLNDADDSVLGYGGGITNGVAASAKEVTLTFEHPFTANLLGRLEGRYDMASFNGNDAKIYATGSTSGPSASQATATASMTFSF